ncbi:MAG: alpha-galactosidase [Chloroherpetonaceae bacterium]|nr:alpha-galactosidase [Chthonomonadaceae bacterium]MDW8208513.1 alpha-galactosidase [Chloroherpetonaceae bacterium]
MIGNPLSIHSRRVLLRAGLLGFLGAWSALPAVATYRGGFFNPGRRPEIRFQRSTMTWTLRNQAVERVIQYDPKAGSLQTVRLRNLRQRVEIAPEPGSEALFSFIAPLVEPPVPLVNWRRSSEVLSERWAQPDFDDRAWQATRLPLTGLQSGQVVWLRASIPPGRMTPGRAYALTLERAPDADYQVFVDGTLVLQLEAQAEPGKQFLQVDLDPKNRVVAVRIAVTGPRFREQGSIGIAETGSAPQNIDLRSDWKYLVHTVNTGGDGSRTLTITLSGTKRYEGFELNVSYQVHGGEEPTLAKWFLFVSHRPTRFLIESVTYDGWQMPGNRTEAERFADNALVVVDPVSRQGVMAAVLSPLGGVERSRDGNALRAVLRPAYRVRPDNAILMPRSLVSVFTGTPDTGAFLHQLYLGQYVVPGNPHAVPPAFHSGLGYGLAITAEACLRNLQPAMDLGLGLFVLGNGWQANSGGADNGIYGDWNVDRRKFPQGLAPIALLVRQYRMQFGLWTAPAVVSTKSQAARTLGDYLVRRPDGTPAPGPETETLHMCFTSGWEDNFSQSLLMLCRELSVTGLHLDGHLPEIPCANPGHDHPVGYPGAEQVQHQRLFASKMLKLDAQFVLMRDSLSGTEFSDLEHTRRIQPEPFLLPEGERPADAREWRARIAAYRRRLLQVMPGLPGFALSAVALVRLPGGEKDLELLEYSLTSAAALGCNLEIHGELDRLTLEERNLVRRWVQWNATRRPYLAFSQRLRLSDPNVDGVLHLRDALQERYGYLCLWSLPGEGARSVTVSIRPADYGVPMNPGRVVVIRERDGTVFPVRIEGDTLRLNVELTPGSWEIFEFRVK